MVVMGAPGDYQQERLRRVVETRRADAVVLAATRREDDRIDYLVEAGFPFATLGRSRPVAALIRRSTLTSRRRGPMRWIALSRVATCGSQPSAPRTT